MHTVILETIYVAHGKIVVWYNSITEHAMMIKILYLKIIWWYNPSLHLFIDVCCASRFNLKTFVQLCLSHENLNKYSTLSSMPTVICRSHNPDYPEAPEYPWLLCGLFTLKIQQQYSPFLFAIYINSSYFNLYTSYV